MTNKNGLFIFGFSLSLMMASPASFAFAQYYGVNDSVEIDLSVLDGPSIGSPRLFEPVELTPPPVADAPSIAPAPVAVPLFSKIEQCNYSYKPTNAFADEAAARTAPGVKTFASMHSKNIKTAEIPSGYSASPNYLPPVQDRVLKPSSHSAAMPTIQTEPLAYADSDDKEITVETIAPPIPLGNKTAFKPPAPAPAVIAEKTVVTKTHETVFKPASTDARMSTIDRAMNALKANKTSR